MSLIMSQGDGVTVITVTTNPKSKWPLLCQILGNLCCSPACSVARHMKGELTNTLKAFAVIQIIVGVINLVLGILRVSFQEPTFVLETGAPFWLGSVFLAIGIVCILAAKFPSPCLMFIAAILNIVSVGLAIAAVVIYSLDMAVGSYYDICSNYYYSPYDGATPSSEQRRDLETCHYFKHLNRMILGGFDIMMIVLSVLQLCISISFCVVTLKALSKNNAAEKSVEDAQPYKPLLEDASANPAC